MNAAQQLRAHLGIDVPAAPAAPAAPAPGAPAALAPDAIPWPLAGPVQVAPDDDACDMHTRDDGSWWENDAQGIPLARVCDRCIARKLAGYRPEILTGYTQADVSEPIEADGDW